MASILSSLISDVEDIERSLAFYNGMLQLPIMRKQTFDGHKLAYLGTGSTEILLLEQPKNEQNPSLERSGGLGIKFYVQHLPVVAQWLTQEHVRVLRDLDMAAAGEHTFLVADPDGYAVLLSEPVVETLH